jgi:hypothetical protein
MPRKKLTYTKREAIRLHRELWNMLAKAGCDKPFILGVMSSCYLCQYVYEKAGTTARGACNQYCPADWSAPDTIAKIPTCVDRGTYYRKWDYLESADPRKKDFAKLIANIPIRKKEKL